MAGSKELPEIIALNQYRGNFSWSCMNLSSSNIDKDFGNFNLDILTDSYSICHVQSPTGSLIKETSRIHPSDLNGTYLWHNGLISRKGIKKIKEILLVENIVINENEDSWDTRWLHTLLYFTGFKYLSEIEGLFTCIYKTENKIYMFRTKHGKLYIDKDFNISSEKYKDSKMINFDTIYETHHLFNNKWVPELKEKDKFKTKRFNTLILGEL